MAILHVKTPSGTTKTVDLETMNIESSLQQNGWCKLPNGLIIQWQTAYYSSNVYPPTNFTTALFAILHTFTVSSVQRWGHADCTMGDIEISGDANINGPWIVSKRDQTTTGGMGGSHVTIGY